MKPCQTCFGAGCRRCTHCPPGVNPARWVTLLAVARQFDDRVNAGAGTPRKTEIGASTSGNGTDVRGSLGPKTSVPGAAQTAREPANPDGTGVSNAER